MNANRAVLQIIDIGVKVYNLIFGTNFKLVILLKGNFYSCDFVKIQDEKLVSLHSEWEYQLFELSPLSGNTNLPSVKNSFFRKFKGTYYHDSATIQARYESLKNFPDLLLKQICDSLTELNLKYETPDENYPYIYNLKNIDTGVILPFIDLEYEDYRLVSLYQDE